MAMIKWFENELRMAAEFSAEAMPIIAAIEAYEEKIETLIQEKDSLKLEIGEQVVYDSRKKLLEHTIHRLNEENIRKAEELSVIKQSYLAQEILDTLETLTSVDEGEKVADDATKLLMKITNICTRYLKPAFY